MSFSWFYDMLIRATELHFISILFGVCVDIMFLWPPCVADADIIFCSYGFFCLSSFFFFPRLFSAVPDQMSVILPHMMWL